MHYPWWIVKQQFLEHNFRLIHSTHHQIQIKKSLRSKQRYVTFTHFELGHRTKKLANIFLIYMMKYPCLLSWTRIVLSLYWSFLAMNLLRLTNARPVLEEESHGRAEQSTRNLTYGHVFGGKNSTNYKDERWLLNFKPYETCYTWVSQLWHLCSYLAKL